MMPGPPFQAFCLSLVVKNNSTLKFSRVHDTEEDGVADISMKELVEVKSRKRKDILLDSDFFNKTVGHCIDGKYLVSHCNNETFTNEEIEHLTLGSYCNPYVTLVLLAS